MSPESFLASCSVDPAVFALRPDYRAMVVVAEGTGADLGASLDTGSAADELLIAAEEHARTLIAETPVEELPHIAAWREAYRAFGAKPQRTRNSLEALTRRADKGLPRVNQLTDIYNAISVLHQIPFGGEDLDAYVGPARLSRASGEERFETVADGQSVIEHPEPGEVIWADDAGITCRRWNWRQGPRTGLRPATTTAFFILDALAPATDVALDAAVDQLADALGTQVMITRRLISAS